MNITTPKDHLYQLDIPRKMNKKNVIILTVVIVVLIVVGYFFGNQKIALAPATNLKNNSKVATDKAVVTTSSSKITIANQIPGEVVLVSEVMMNENGWVAVHDDVDGKPGNILGAYFLNAGTYKNQMVPLLRGVTDDHSYLVVIHKDDGDKVFDYKIDTPVTNTKGEVETASFNVVAESPRGE